MKEKTLKPDIFLMVYCYGNILWGIWQKKTVIYFDDYILTLPILAHLPKVENKGKEEVNEKWLFREKRGGGGSYN